MKTLSKVAFIFASLLFAGAAIAQQGSDDQVWAEFKKLDWKCGPTQGDIATAASVQQHGVSTYEGRVHRRLSLQQPT